MVCSMGLVASVAASAWGQTGNACDLNGSGTVTSADVDLAVNMSLGVSPCTANVISPGVCNVLVVQRIVNAMTGACVTGNGRAVELNWLASTTAGVVGYHVYRGTSLANLQQLTTVPVTGTRYVDNNVANGTTYVYVVRSVGSTGLLSVNSNAANAVVPAS